MNHALAFIPFFLLITANANAAPERKFFPLDHSRPVVRLAKAGNVPVKESSKYLGLNEKPAELPAEINVASRESNSKDTLQAQTLLGIFGGRKLTGH